MGLTFILPPALGRAKATARAELLEAALRRDLGETVTAVIAESYGELEEQVTSGKAELAWAPTAVCAKLGPVRAVFTIARNGQTSYRSALVGRARDAHSLASLHGARAAWVDPLSAGGYLLAVAKLRSAGIDPDTTFAAQSFLGSHRAAVEAVLHETADVTAVSVHTDDDAGVADELRWYAGPAGDQLALITVTESCPNDAIVITAALGDAAAKRIAERLVPTTPGARVRSRLLSALEADWLARADIEVYRRLAPLFAQGSGRGTLPPPRSSPSRLPPR